jgi:hypothetical protein
MERLNNASHPSERGRGQRARLLMKKLIPFGRAMAALLLATAASVPMTATAQAAPAGSDADKWQFTAGLYGWFATIKGTIVSDTGTTDIDLPFGDLVDALKMAFMGEIAVHNGRWGAFADTLYLDVGSGKLTQTRNLSVGGATFPVTTSESADVKANVWTFAGAYRVVSSPDWTMDVIAGARSLYLKAKIDYSIGPILGNKESSGTVWNGIVGVKGRYSFADQGAWFVPFYVDIGTGESSLTWHALAGIGYKFRWGDAVAAWRYMDWNGKSGKSIQDLNINGPILGVQLHF